MSRLRSLWASSVLVAATATTASAREPGPYDVTQLAKGQSLPAGVKAKGADLDQVWTWTDGDFATAMAAVFSSTTTTKDGHVTGRKLYVQLYRGKPGKLRQIRLVQDAVSGCEFDVVAGFVAGSVSVTDDDGDDLAELTFAYDVDCVSDVSPTVRKLLVLENKAKYALRGTRAVVAGPDPVKDRLGGEFTATGFGKSKDLQTAAEARWKELVAR